MMADKSQGSLYLGFDLSTQQLKAVVIASSLQVVAQAKVDFDGDFGAKYGIHKGVHVVRETGEVYAPVAMWLESLDLVLERLRAEAARQGDEAMLGRIRAVSGSGQQHGSVWWSDKAHELLGKLDGEAEGGLKAQLEGSLAYDMAPNWQDQSTQEQCDAFDQALGGRDDLAEATGSGAHHRFTGTQIMRLRTVKPDMYARTARISLVSSWLASVLMGAIAPLDISDACGMNLWDMPSQQYNDKLLALAAGGDPADLRRKLGEVRLDGGGSMGSISPYFARRFGFAPDCQVAPFTGDNPATILALPLRPLDAIVSLGTSTTFLMNTPKYKPDESYHFFHHPTDPGHYMFMLCYKNGGLAREKIRDRLPAPPPGEGRTGWENFNDAVLGTPPLGRAREADRAKLGLYFYLRETVPNIPAGTWRYTAAPDGSDLREEEKARGAAGEEPSAVWDPETDARIIVESQALSMRLRSQNLVHPPAPALPAQPRRIYLVGGGSLNPAIARVIGDVLGGADGVYKLDVGGSACAMGGAYKALWAMERAGGETFDELIGKRWHEDGMIEKVDQGFRDGTYQRYGDVLGAFEAMEKKILAEQK